MEENNLDSGHLHILQRFVFKKGKNNMKLSRQETANSGGSRKTIYYTGRVIMMRSGRGEEAEDADDDAEDNNAENDEAQK